MEVFKHLRLQRPSATSCAQTLPKLDLKKGERSSVADVGDDDIQFISHRVAGCYATYAAQGALDPDCHKRPAPYILFFSHHCVKAVSRLPLLLRQPCQDKRWAEVHTKG